MRYLIVLCFALSCISCASINRATDLGGKIGSSFAESAKKGEPLAETALVAWPYAHGVVKGLMGPNYAFEINEDAKASIKQLDKFSKIPKEELTKEQKGYILGALCRLETIAIRQTWKRYGVNLWRLLTGG